MNPKARSGFTLVELSIVIVIIGLLAASVLVGRDLIAAAQVRKVISKLESYETAVQAFREKYHCLPGDCVDALDFGLGDTNCPTPYNYVANDPIDYPGCNGNGDGYLGNTSPAPGPCTYPYCPEHLNFWYHLSRAQMIGDDVDGVTGIANGTLPYYYPVFGKSSPFLGVSDWGVEVFGGHYIIGDDTTGAEQYKLSSQDEYHIDVKIDDGLPYSGNVMDFSGMPAGCVRILTVPVTYNLDDNFVHYHHCLLGVRIKAFPSVIN